MRNSSGRRKGFLRRTEDIEGPELWLSREVQEGRQCWRSGVDAGRRLAGLDRSTAERIDNVVLGAVLNWWNKEGVCFLACVLCSFEL